MYFPGRIVARRAASPTVTLLDLSVPSLRFQPGQWLDFRIPGADWIGGFSLVVSTTSSVPFASDDEMAITTTSASRATTTTPVVQIAVKDSNQAPAQWVTKESRVGDEVSVQVGGTCILHNDSTSPAVFVAGGIGISPLLSLYSQHVHEQRPPVKFLYSMRNMDEFVFRNELLQLLRPDDSLTVALTQDKDPTPAYLNSGHPPNVSFRSGRQLKPFLDSIERQDNPVCYICGPPAMQDEAIEYLTNVLPTERLVYERWW